MNNKSQVVSASQAIPGVKQIVAIASGKGGVGKSTTTVNLALALLRLGARVGILDADIYGPNIPQMLGVSGSPKSLDAKRLEPLIGHGIQSMSIGYLLPQDDRPVIWRGPMVSGALQQLLRDTNWDNLDYLLIDLPPGTGDIQLTMSQKIPVTGGVIVTTPQDVALSDARRGLQMFNKVRIPALGIIENMSHHVCSACGQVDPIFDKGGGAKLSARYDVPLLASVPLDRAIREGADAGQPVMVTAPDSLISKTYILAAEQLQKNLSLQAKQHAGKFPKIVVETKTN